MNYKALLVGCVFCGVNVSAQNLQDSITKKTHNLDEVVVLGNSGKQKNLLSPRMGNISMSSEQIKNVIALFGEADVLKALQVQPGVSGGVDGFSGMYVRGGNNDGNLYMLHGLPLYHVSHVGGLFSSFNVAAIEKADFYKAGFPASFGGRISSITNLRLKESNFMECQGQAALGLLSGNVFLTAPLKKEKVAFSVGLRRSWLDMITALALAVMNKINENDGKKKIGRYAFSDVNLKLDYKGTGHIKGYTQFYWGNDYLKLGESNFLDDTAWPYEEESVTRMKWGNWGISTGATLHTGMSTLFSLNAYYTHYSSFFKQEQEERSSGDGASVNEYTRKKNANGIDDLGINLSMETYFNENYQLKTGVDYIYHNYLPERLTIANNKDNDKLDILAGGERIKAHEWALYVDNDFTISEHWRLNMGARGVFYHSFGEGRTTLEPRLNLRYSLNRDYSLKAGYSRMTQFVQQICNSYISLPTDSWQPVFEQNSPLTSDQVTVGLYGNLPAGLYFSVEGYYKWMNNLLEYKEGVHSFSSHLDWNDKLTLGKGSAYGVDVSVYKNSGKLTGSIGYGLLWNSRQFAELNKGRSFPSKYDNRHKLNLVATYKLNEHVELNAGWTYMTGNRVTLALDNYHGTEGSGFPEDMAPTGIIQSKWGLDYYSTRNNVRLPAYHRLDLGINLYRRLGKGRQGIWNIGLYNAYSRMNPIAINKKGLENIQGESGEWNTRFQTLGIFPVIPSVSYTYKF